METKISQVRSIAVQYGKCLELVSMDPHFHNMSVGLFLKDRTLSVWSYFSQKGVEERLQVIRDKMVEWGEVLPTEIGNQAAYRDGEVIERPLKFMFVKSVEISPSAKVPQGPIQAQDNKSKLVFQVSGQEEDGKWIYTVSASGDAERPERRIRAVTGGYMRYGGCTRISPCAFAFPDGKRHDGFARILITYAKNVSSAENALQAQELQGQMTTQTLGFSQT